MIKEAEAELDDRCKKREDAFSGMAADVLEDLFRSAVSNEESASRSHEKILQICRGLSDSSRFQCMSELSKRHYDGLNNLRNPKPAGKKSGKMPCSRRHCKGLCDRRRAKKMKNKTTQTLSFSLPDESDGGDGKSTSAVPAAPAEAITDFHFSMVSPFSDFKTKL